MTTQLVPLFAGTIAGETTELVNARKLHTFLENKDLFANWIKDRITQYDFVENQDFISFLENTKKPQGGRQSKEYHITLDMAKELSMVERNAKGKQARRYFIDCERQLTTTPYGLKSRLNDTLTLAEFIAFQEQLAALNEQLLACKVVISAKDCLKLDLNKTLAKIQREESEKQEDFKIADTIIQMEYEGKPRHEIVKAVNRNFNAVRQVIFQARRDGLLPAKGGTA
jgi:phage anti-repressor protein